MSFSNFVAFITIVHIHEFSIGTQWSITEMTFVHQKLNDLTIPLHNEVVGGYTGFTLSVCPSVRPTSTLYRLQFWLDPFHIYSSYQATSDGVSRKKFLEKINIWIFGNFFFKFVTLTLSSFDLESDVNH